MTKEAPPAYYDDVFAPVGKYERGREHYYAWAIHTVHALQLHNLLGLEIGCGPGGFLEMGMHDNLRLEGIDFSQEAVIQSRTRTHYPVHHIPFQEFQEWDRFQYYVILETLEHLEDDIGLLRRIPVGSWVIGSVPNRRDPSHIRQFPGIPAVQERYQPVLDNMVAVQLHPTLFGFFGRVKP